MYSNFMLVFFLRIVFSYVPPNDSFIIVNRTLGSKALTLFNYETRDSDLPLRLISITPKNIKYQSFNLLYNNDHHIWFSPEIDNSYISIGGSIYITAQKGDVDPNLKLEYIKSKEHGKVFRIIKSREYENNSMIAEKKDCLTVDDIMQGGTEKEYWPLVFTPCEKENIKQDFIFIPTLVGLSYVDEQNKFQISDIERAYEKLNRLLRNVEKFEDDKKKDNSSTKSPFFSK